MITVRDAIPAPVHAALLHVKAHCPDVDRVTFMIDSIGGTMWCYAGPDGPSNFEGKDIDDDTLEAALDAAYNLHPFPVCYVIGDEP